MEKLEICPVRQAEALLVPELKEMQDFCCYHPCMQKSALHCRVGVCVCNTNFQNRGLIASFKHVHPFIPRLLELRPSFLSLPPKLR